MTLRCHLSSIIYVGSNCILYSARLLFSSSLGTAACYEDERPAQGLRTLYYIRMGTQHLERAESDSATGGTQEGVQGRSELVEAKRRLRLDEGREQ